MRRQYSGGKEPVSRSSKRPLVIEVMLGLIIVFVIFVTVFKITEFFLSTTNNFPRMDIYLANVPIEQIEFGNIESKLIKYDGNSITFDNHLSKQSFDDVQIKGRGNSTWLQVKKPYQIKLPEKVALVGNGKAKKWLLIANYLDESHLRNEAAFYLQRLLDVANPINAQFLELYIDGNYRGLYYLTEKVEIGKDRINLENPLGIITEIDNLHTYNAENCDAFGENGDCFVVSDVVNEDNKKDALEAFIAKFHQLEAAISKQNFTQISTLIDVDSFAKYFLLNEFSNNIDAYGTSLFFIMDGPDDLIHAGSGWDFDSSFANKNLAMDGFDKDYFSRPATNILFKDIVKPSSSNKIFGTHYERLSMVFFDLIDIPEFQNRVREIFQETLSGHQDDLINHLLEQANYIHSAALRDRERWKIRSDFDEEVTDLTYWIEKRYAFFEQTYGQVFSEPTN